MACGCGLQFAGAKTRRTLKKKSNKNVRKNKKASRRNK